MEGAATIWVTKCIQEDENNDKTWNNMIANLKKKWRRKL